MDTDTLVESTYFERLAMVASALTNDLATSEIIDIVVKQGIAALGADGCTFALIDNAGNMAFMAAHGYSVDVVAALPPLTIDSPFPIPAAVRTRAPVFVGTREQGHAEFPGLAALASTSQAWAAIPLEIAGAVVGVLGVSYTVPRAFDSMERTFITALANIAARPLLAGLTSGGSFDRVLRAATAASAVGTAIIDDDRSIIYLNHALADMLGTTVDAAHRTDIRDHFAIGDPIHDVLRDLGRDPLDVVSVDARVQRRDGAAEWVAVTIAPLTDTDEQNMTVVNAVDVTDRPRRPGA